MPLEDLIPLGYEVYRVPSGAPATDHVVGYDRMWRLSNDMVDGDGNTIPGVTEDEVVQEATDWKTLHDQMQQALANNNTYLASNQNSGLQRAQVAALTTQVNALVRQVFNL